MGNWPVWQVQTVLSLEHSVKMSQILFGGIFQWFGNGKSCTMYHQYLPTKTPNNAFYKLGQSIHFWVTSQTALTCCIRFIGTHGLPVNRSSAISVNTHISAFPLPIYPPNGLNLYRRLRRLTKATFWIAAALSAYACNWPPLATNIQ